MQSPPPSAPLARRSQRFKVRPYFVLCGQAFKSPLQLSQDEGFGCLGERAGTSETLRVWVQPLPAGWDAAQTCAAGEERSFYPGLHLGPAQDNEGLAPEPDPRWAQGSRSAQWRRDISPCGGVLSAELELRFP
jgi:hypothetical protein